MKNKQKYKKILNIIYFFFFLILGASIMIGLVLVLFIAFEYDLLIR